MYPTNNKIYVPSVDVKERELTIEEVRQNGKVVALSDDGTRATVQVTVGLTVCYCGVIMADDGTIKEFIPRPKRVHTYVKDKADQPDIVETPPPE